MTAQTFDANVLEMAPRLRAFLRRRVRDDATADDLTQDTLLKVYRSRSALRDGTRLQAWLYRVARTAADRATVAALFAPLGDSPEVAEEKIEAFVVFTAIGPTYLWFQMQALRELAVSFGLTEAEGNAGLKRMVCGARSKAGDEFGDVKFDFVITVCDHAQESCPVWPGQPVVGHWGLPDPAAVTGPEELKYRAFVNVASRIARRVERFCAFSVEQLAAFRVADLEAIDQDDGGAGKKEVAR